MTILKRFLAFGLFFLASSACFGGMIISNAPHAVAAGGGGTYVLISTGAGKQVTPDSGRLSWNEIVVPAVNDLVVVPLAYANAGNFSISDNCSNSWLNARTSTVSATQHFTIRYTKVTGTCSNPYTITITTATVTLAMSCTSSVWRGGTGTIDVSTSGAGNSGTVFTSSCTTTASDSTLAIAGFADAAGNNEGTTLGGSGSWTTLFDETNGALNEVGSAAYWVSSSALKTANPSCVWTNLDVANYAACIAVFH